MAVRLASRGQVPPFRAMDVLKDVAALQAQGRETFLLCLGQPSTPAPQPVIEAASRALRSDALGYTASNGLPQLRERIAEHYRERYGASVDPASIVITTGSSAAFTALFLAAFEAGDAVAMTRPGYPAYRNTLRSLGCELLDLDCGPETRWQPTVQMLDTVTEARDGNPPAGLVIASPANPTGTILGAQQLKEICEWCDAHGTLLVSDEIYHGIEFDVSCASAVQFSAANVTVGSFSKYYSMTGWRLGWAVLPRELVRPVELLLGNLNLSAPTLSQIAAVQAFGPAARVELDKHVERYASNRMVVMEALARMGVTHLAPADGAFYCYADVSDFTPDSAAWAGELLQATGVAVTPGIDFAENACPNPPLGVTNSHELDGSRFVRISCAGSIETVCEGMARLEAFVNCRSASPS